MNIFSKLISHLNLILGQQWLDMEVGQRDRVPKSKLAHENQTSFIPVNRMACHCFVSDGIVREHLEGKIAL